MVIAFKEQFVEPILDDLKNHTIREDATNRWKVGMTMHMATGVRTKKYKQFAEKVCTGIQKIEFKWATINKGLVNEGRSVKVFIDDRNVTNEWFEDTNEMIVEVLAKNDGFNNLVDFFGWFSEDFTGKLIHWTDLKY